MPNNPDVMLSVTLVNPGPNGYLKVDETGYPTHLEPSTRPQCIVWTLMGDAADGSFLPLQGPNPGFAWVPPPPPPGIFDRPVLLAPNQLKICDHHTGPGTAGTWSYTLRARINELDYSTIPVLDADQNTNPRIKNN
jgi:hypothetical protein